MSKADIGGRWSTDYRPIHTHGVRCSRYPDDCAFHFGTSGPGAKIPERYRGLEACPDCGAAIEQHEIDVADQDAGSRWTVSS